MKKYGDKKLYIESPPELNSFIAALPEDFPLSRLLLISFKKHSSSNDHKQGNADDNQKDGGRRSAVQTGCKYDGQGDGRKNGKYGQDRKRGKKDHMEKSFDLFHFIKSG